MGATLSSAAARVQRSAIALAAHLCFRIALDMGYDNGPMHDTCEDRGCPDPRDTGRQGRRSEAAEMQTWRVAVRGKRLCP
jgi:hypothetical protein